MVRTLLFAALSAAIGYVCYDLGQSGARAYERMLVARAGSALDVLGYGWASVEADGMRLTLRGQAPDGFSRDLAIRSVRATAPLARVTSDITAPPAPPQHLDPVRVELHRDRNGVTVTGRTAGRKMRDRLDAALAADGQGLAVDDLATTKAAQPPPGWGAEIGVATLAAARLPNAYVVVEPGRVTVDGQAADEADRKALTTALLQRAGDGVALVLRIRTPPKVIAPFAFSAYKDVGGGIRLERCAARGYDEQAELVDRLNAAGAEHRPDPCPVGLGGPGGEWLAAVSAGLDALVALPAGRIDIEYRDARLVAAPPTSPAVFSEVVENFREALPEGFTGKGDLHADDAATRAGIGRERFWLQLRQSAGRIVLAGRVADAAAETAIETQAKALYGADAVDSALTVVDAASPAGWRIAALRVLDDLQDVQDGEAELAGDHVTLRGTIADPALARKLQDRMTAELPEHTVRTVLRVDVPAAVAAIPLPPQRCAAVLNAANADPSLDFATGSAGITDESRAALDAIAAAFRRCGTGRIEIGGHTDSQGPSDLNLRLSETRAEAVMHALSERGVPPERMVARGFGEENPIATNETEAGRAQNRRIEFEPAG